MPITLITAGLCGLLLVILSYRVSSVRRSAKVSLGDGGDHHLLGRIRAHANFAEYVPICLILLMIAETATRSSMGLWIAGIALVVIRISHAIGMDMDAPNPFRVIGTAGTWLLMILLSVYVIKVAFDQGIVIG